MKTMLNILSMIRVSTKVVLQKLLKFVIFTDEPVEDPIRGEIKRLKMQSISPLIMQDSEEIRQDSTNEGTTTSFTESISLEELARIQGVKPISDVRALYGTWPGDDDDGFEEAIAALRRSQIVGND